MDQQSQQHLEEADKKAKAYLKGSRKNKERNLEEEKQIKGELKKTLELGDEKVQLAVQTYELVIWFEFKKNESKEIKERKIK